MIKLNKTEVVATSIILLSLLSFSFLAGLYVSKDIEMRKPVDGKAEVPIALCSERTYECYDPIGRIISF